MLPGAHFREKVCYIIIMIFFHHDLSFLIIIGAVTVAATVGILIDFDDCLHHNEYEKWVTNIYIVCTISHTFNINY